MTSILQSAVRFTVPLILIPLIGAIGCSTTTLTKNYVLNEQIKAAPGAPMVSWETRHGTTKEFLYMGRTDAMVRIVYREYREGTGQDLLRKDLVFSIAENYSADSKLFVISLIVFEGLEMRVTGLKDDSIIFFVTADHSDLR